MTTITEDYVSFETAKLLKEKGFPQDPNICNTAYTAKGKFSNNAKSFAFYYELIKPRVYYTAPTLQMAMKWMREVHHVACFICPSIEQGFHTNKWNSYVDKLSDNFPKDPLWFVETSDSYEEACEVTIKYCLENSI